MPIRITPKKLKEAFPAPLLLEASTGSAFPDTRALQSSGCFSSLLFYDSHCPDFCIRLSNYFLATDVGWDESSAADSILTLQFVLHHSLTYRMEDGPKKVMAEGQYNMIASPNASKINWFDKANSHTSTLDIHFSPSYLQKMGGDFPELVNLLEKRATGLTDAISSSPAITSPPMMQILKAIIDCPYTGDLRRNYVQSKVSILLLLALEQITSRPVQKNTTIHLKRYDLERLHEAREYLLLNMDNPPTLQELAHKMGLNDFKLKKGYKQVFGTTIFTDFNKERMDKAVQYLLEKNMSIADTALLSGYQDPPNFIRAFKQYFGSPPGELRKRHEQLLGKTASSNTVAGKRFSSSTGKRRS